MLLLLDFCIFRGWGGARETDDLQGKRRTPSTTRSEKKRKRPILEKGMGHGPPNGKILPENFRFTSGFSADGPTAGLVDKRPTPHTKKMPTKPTKKNFKKKTVVDSKKLPAGTSGNFRETSGHRVP